MAERESTPLQLEGKHTRTRKQTPSLVIWSKADSYEALCSYVNSPWLKDNTQRVECFSRRHIAIEAYIGQRQGGTVMEMSENCRLPRSDVGAGVATEHPRAGTRDSTSFLLAQSQMQHVHGTDHSRVQRSPISKSSPMRSMYHAERSKKCIRLSRVLDRCQ